MKNEIIIGDCRDILKKFPNNHIQCCVTSPPYYRLRDYGVEGQIGLESSPEEYVSELVGIFNEVKRVLRDDGTLWLNLGDSYAGSNKGIMADGSISGGKKQRSNKGTMHGEIKKSGIPSGLKPKDLIGIPWRVAFALQAEGWYLRQDIIWAKTNPMPESVKDRCCKSHEYIFLFSKSKNYYFNHEIIREPAAYDGRKDTVFKGSEKYSNTNLIFHERGHERWQRGVNGEYLRNKRSVWSVNNKSYKGVHFATFPDTLIEPCILAGSKEQSIVLDPFAGSGTVGEVCRIHNRNYILIELNPDYEKLIYERTLYETNSISNW